MIQQYLFFITAITKLGPETYGPYTTQKKAREGAKLVVADGKFDPKTDSIYEQAFGLKSLLMSTQEIKATDLGATAAE